MTTDDVGYQVLTADTAASYVASRPELASLIDTTSLARVEGQVSLERILSRMGDVRISDAHHGPAGAR